jgi:crotonobetainyl-CoA:carnitine CoA-transferase CaiB-like acyl-CoA transferase
MTEGMTATGEGVPPLDGVRVVELATGVAGPFAGKLLAAYGADVVKVEPPGGDPARRHGPFPPDVGPDDEGAGELSALFLHLNADKRSVVADLGRADGRDLVAGLVDRADVVIESTRPGALDEVGLGVGSLLERNPRLVVASVTPFGQDGPYAGLVGEEIVTYAMGGPMSATGREDGEPLKLAGNVISHQCGNLAALASVAALTVAERSGRGIHIDLSMFEAQMASVDRRATHLLWHRWSGRVPAREPASQVRLLPAGCFPTADGHTIIFTLPAWAPRMVETLGDEELRAHFADPGWATDESTGELVESRLYPWLFEHTKDGASQEAQANRWSVTPLNAPVEVFDDPHVVERRFFVDVVHPAAGPVRHLAPPFRIGEAGDDARRPPGPAPLLDQHGPAVRAESAAPMTTRPVPDPAGSEPQLPLGGIRVLDLTVVWAGPACTMHLADLGAEVIRVDNPWVFPPATRGVRPRPDPDSVAAAGPLGGYPHLDTRGRPWNKHSMWSAHARNKLSCTLDLRRPEAVEHFLRLVDRADVLVENNSVGVLEKLGIGWDVLHARNPRFVCLRMPPLGLTGPRAGWMGVGTNFEALCGLARLRGYRDGDPTRLTAAFHMDPASGTAGALAVLLALRRRERTGVGELIELAQGENMMHHIGEYFVDAARTGRVHEPAGNRHPTRAPQGCYPCAGDDRWAVISVGTDEEWRALVAAMGQPAWADDRFATAADRRRLHDELDEAIGAWTAGLDRWEVTRRCQDRGVPAGPVLDEADAYADPHLAARGFFRDQGSVDVGTWPFPGHPWRWTGPDLRWEPINRLGDANEYVWKELVGLDDGAYEALVDGGHISEDYVQPDGSSW